MAVFNVRYGPLRSLPEKLSPGTFWVTSDEQSAYCDLIDERNPDDCVRIRIGDFQIFDSFEDLRTNNNKSPTALYYIKSQKNSSGIEIGDVFVRYDKDKDEFVKINADAGATSAEIEQTDLLGNNNLLTDVRYDPNTRKLTFVMGDRAAKHSDFYSVKGTVETLNADVDTVGSVKYQVYNERVRAERAEEDAQDSADRANQRLDDLEYSIGKDFGLFREDMQTIMGNDKSDSGRATKSIRMIAHEEIVDNLIPPEAQEALDTLQEIADWIQEHPGEAQNLASALQQIREYVGTIPSEASSGDVVNYISELTDKKISALDSSATIATNVNGVVKLKGGLTENNGIVSNDNSTDITLAKVATTGKAEDIKFPDGRTLPEVIEEITSWHEY